MTWLWWVLGTIGYLTFAGAVALRWYEWSESRSSQLRMRKIEEGRVREYDGLHDWDYHHDDDNALATAILGGMLAPFALWLLLVLRAAYRRENRRLRAAREREEQDRLLERARKELDELA